MSKFKEATTLAVTIKTLLNHIDYTERPPKAVDDLKRRLQKWILLYQEPHGDRELVASSYKYKTLWPDFMAGAVHADDMWEHVKKELNNEHYTISVSAAVAAIFAENPEAIHKYYGVTQKMMDRAIKAIDDKMHNYGDDDEIIYEIASNRFADAILTHYRKCYNKTAPKRLSLLAQRKKIIEQNLILEGSY